MTISTAQESLRTCLCYDIGFQVTVVEDEVCPITTKLVLDQDEETKEPLVQVHRNLVTRLKPHQVDG